MAEHGGRVTVVPADTSPEAVLDLAPDGDSEGRATPRLALRRHALHVPGHIRPLHAV